ncbi:MAG: hypothetical protein HKN52_00405, partial [Eudoraea sp.]|nr:hypothetical protein [Eudoraea sp.]
MSRLKIICLVLLLPLCGFTIAHKFYVSVTNIEYYEKEDALQITSRIFIDDFEGVLEERYDITAQLATPNEIADANVYIEKYLKAKFLLELNGEPVDFNFLGKKYDNDMMICYLEIPQIGFQNIRSIQIQNELLMD